MTIVDELHVAAPPDLCFRVGADVERWPDILPHYRWVRFTEKRGFGTGRVEMAAWRDFGGPLRWPTWWESEMHVDPDEPAVHYVHVRGITKGMVVKWAFLPEPGGTRLRITHAWDGPGWPLIGGIAWRRVIAPRFVHVIAGRTLAGVAREAVRRRDAGGDVGPTHAAATPGRPGAGG
jgi:hypothetical protein